MKRIAESYVKLVLAVGQHDADYVDAYYGPPEWRAEAEAHKRPLPEIRAEAETLIAELAAASAGGRARREIVRLRHAYLPRQLQAMVARIDLLPGKKMKFDEESKALYDAVAPTYGAAHFQEILDRLDKAVPGEGTLAGARRGVPAGFRDSRDRLDAVFKAAIDECRRRTLAAHRAAGRARASSSST